jgi:uncharacterized membrane protein YkvA (DUF1232 family)
MQKSTDSIVEKSVAIGALLYFITPVDAIPDYLPVVGFLDDAGVIALAVTYYGKKLKTFLGEAKDTLAKW